MSRAKNRDQRVVIGSKVLDEYRLDLDDTILPDWLTPSPRQIGDAGQGKLSANEWRSAACIHFLITLGRLWGVLPPDDRFHQMWINYAHLVIVTIYASRRSTSRRRQDAITEHMKTYLEGVRKLFVQVAIGPNHHLTLHLAAFLHWFGPPHSWWSFPFERYNGMLQNIPHNFKFGECYHLRAEHQH